MSPPPCRHRGRQLTGPEREARGLSHARRWRFCLHTERPLGEAVCHCKGCGPTCPGYALFLILYHPPDRPAAEPFDPLPHFPPHALACHHAAFAEAHLEWLRDRRILEADRADWHTHQRNATYCADRWRALVLARTGGEDRDGWWPAEVWQDHLRDLLGDEDFAAGRMPPVVPPWHVRPDP